MRSVRPCLRADAFELPRAPRKLRTQILRCRRKVLDPRNGAVGRRAVLDKRIAPAVRHLVVGGSRWSEIGSSCRQRCFVPEPISQSASRVGVVRIGTNVPATNVRITKNPTANAAGAAREASHVIERVVCGAKGVEQPGAQVVKVLLSVGVIANRVETRPRESSKA